MSPPSEPCSKGAAIVTGAAQGIGKAIAIRLAKDGYDVALNDVEAKEEELQIAVKEIELIGRKSISIVADVTNENSVIEMVKRTVDELGTLRVMVANAGISLTTGVECVNLSVEDFDKVLKVNLGGVFLCYREAARQMIKQGSWGRIIGASSIAGMKGSTRTTGYSASKFGVIGITQCLAAEMAERGITVNAYAPGMINTPMTRSALLGTSESSTNMSEKELALKLREAVSKHVNIDAHMGVPEDIASVVSYLASEESRFMTGQTLSVNGGALFG